MKTVILLGAPGAGKGTAAEIIEQKTPYVQISTGDILREAIRTKTDLGRKVEEYVKSGALVPDEVIISLVKERLEQDDGDGCYLFDGFPRTVNQAVLLDALLKNYDAKIDHVIYMEVPEDVVISRLSGRRICKSCGAVYHVKNKQPAKEGVCDKCDGMLYQRPDDVEETIINRLKVFEKQTSTLISHYEDQKILQRVNAGGESSHVLERILAILID